MFFDLEDYATTYRSTIDPNCVNPNIPKVDNSSLECSEIISTNCVVTAKGFPYLGIGSGETVTSVIEKIKEKFKSISFTIQNLGSGIGILKGFSGGVLTAKTIAAGNNIVLTEANDTITINAIGGGSGGGVIDVTHVQLVTFKNNNQLVPGTFYRITDFRTMYDQPDFDANGVAKTSVAAKMGPIEPIILLALTDNTISSKAYQEDYPEDTIEYILEFTTPVNNTVTKGRIIYRKDEWGNETDFDHRNVLFKRYNDVYNDPIIFFDNGIISSEFKIFTYVVADESSNNKVLGYFSNPDRGIFDLPNIVINGKASNNYFSNESYNLTLLGVDITDNIFTGTSSNSYISASSLISKNNLGNFVNNSFYLSDFESNSIDNCSNNIFEGSYFTANKITIMSNNNIECDFEGNRINFLRDNTISLVQFYSNNINIIDSNTMTSPTDSFDNNTGNSFVGNVLKAFAFSYFQEIYNCTFTSNVLRLFANCTIQSTNFSTATKIYKIENKEIHLAEGSNYFVSYLDQFGARVVNGILS